MSLTKLVIRRPVSAVILIFGIIVFGAMSIFSLPLELTPDMEMPMLIINTVYPGASPEDVEKLVTREVEGTIASLSGIDSIMSTSQENYSLVIVSYEYGTNMDLAYMDLRERLDLIANTLPDDTMEPVVIEMDMNAMEAISLSVTSDSQDNLLYVVESEIVPEFEKLTTVADVSVYGGEEQYIKVELIPELLQQYGVAMTTITSSVSTADFSYPVGTIDFGDQSMSLRSSVQYRTIEALKNIPIPTATGSVLRLGDVANVYETTKNASSISRYNGAENISLGIQKRQSESAVTVARAVRETADALNDEYDNLEISVIYDSSEMITDSLSSVASTLVLGILISMVVLFLFLGDIKASLIVGSSMPISLLVTFIFMEMMGYTMNIVTMSGLVLGVGMMVDNSIVVLDSCFKSRTQNKSIHDAALEGTKFVTLSIVASTITTVVVFFPLASIQGISGQLFGPLGFTIIFSLTASLLSAMTLVPLFFCQFKPEERAKAPAARLLKKLERGYGKLLRKLLKKKKTVMAVSMAILAVSLLLATQLNTELMPAVDEGAISISVSTRPGLKLAQIDEKMRGLEEMVDSHPDVERYSMSAGSGSVLSSGNSTIMAYLKSDRRLETKEIVEQWRLETADIIDCEIAINETSSTAMSMASSDVQVSLRASDLDSLKEAAVIVQEMMQAHPDIIRTSSSLESVKPQTEIVVDPLKAANVGLSPIQVAGSLNAILNGADTVSIKKDNQSYDIRVEYPEGKYQNVSDLMDVQLASPAGIMVPLMDIAEIAFSDSPQTITRQDSQYVITVSGVPTYAAQYTAPKEIEESMKTLELPSGVRVAENAMTEIMVEEFGYLIQAIAVAILLVFMVMAIQFESIKHSLMVMICIPFSLIGSFSFLYLTDSTLSMVSILGFLILVGTVVNNGILFVDTTNQYRRSMDLETALVSTGRNRLRPILMTTLTTVLSMIPLALGVGSGGDMMQGLGVTVIGGLTASTILTLLLLPTFYLIIDGNPKRKEKKAEKKRIKEEERTDKEEAMV
ncbi:efflux RND transporter permease subunit [Ruminococcaceae bacterium OttesenSCG-928-L11]|nr:efflux RND transporter permease subunit [Ruminococcaceae bacterium OttesenSCG-928-L11]